MLFAPSNSLVTGDLRRVGVGRFVELLNHLHVGVKDIDHHFANKGHHFKWISLLLDTIQSPEGIRHLSNQSWEFLVELTISESGLWGRATYNPHVIPPGSPEMGQAGVLDGCCLDDVATRDRRDDRGPRARNGIAVPPPAWSCPETRTMDGTMEREMWRRRE